MERNKLWRDIFLAVLILAAFMWIPITRSIILFILPLGSGIDDLVFFVLLGILVALTLSRLDAIENWIEKVFRKEDKE